MHKKWSLKDTGHINQMLRVRTDLELLEAFKEFPHLLIVKHNFHVADDIMFPDPSCLAFFTAFEENHLETLESKNKIIMFAMDIFEGLIQFYIYSKDPQQTVYDCISFLKSNNLYKCEFEIILNEKGKNLSHLI